MFNTKISKTVSVTVLLTASLGLAACTPTQGKAPRSNYHHAVIWNDYYYPRPPSVLPPIPIEPPIAPPPEIMPPIYIPEPIPEPF
ncbi:MAG: hypothetical protein AB3N13_14170 [Arenibacterium sp.]